MKEHMAIKDNDPDLLKFTQSFPGFNGGKRELRYIVVMLGINSDTYQNTEYEIKRQIGMKLMLYRNDGVIYNIKMYLIGAKIGIGDFEFIGNSRSQIWLIEQDIVGLLNIVNAESHVVLSLNNLSFHAKEKFIFLIDYWINNLDYKKYHVSNLANKIFNVTREMKYLDWFEDDVERVFAAADFFRKKELLHLFNINDSEDVRIHFYKNRLNKDYLELSFQKIRSLYNNRKSRDNKNSKQCNFSLSISADNNISKLAIANRLTRSDVVDMFFKDIKNMRNFDIVKSSQVKF
jgi:hypothetical protein